MERKQIDRINELARIAKERQLTKEEADERAALRRQYLDEFRANTQSVLDSVVIQTPDGKRHKLQRKDKKTL